MGFIIGGLFLASGCLFGAVLFNIDARRCNIARAIRNVLVWFIAVGVTLMVIGVYQVHNMPIYEYCVNIHYIDGYSNTIKYEGCCDPIIKSSRGSYYFSYSEGLIPGVIRFEIIRKVEKK
jgi:hypothetical protein|nr:MAG TPA: hypothetical protein [Caudoviricetes sp.]